MMMTIGSRRLFRGSEPPSVSCRDLLVTTETAPIGVTLAEKGDILFVDRSEGALIDSNFTKI
jgi:hypothetical protein